MLFLISDGIHFTRKIDFRRKMVYINSLLLKKVKTINDASGNSIIKFFLERERESACSIFFKVKCRYSF